MKRIVFLFSLLMISCGPQTNNNKDAGTDIKADAGVVAGEGEGEVNIDAGTNDNDGGVEADAGAVEVDSGVIVEVDAGIVVTVDAGSTEDAGHVDAGTEEDAGATDAGHVDAGMGEDAGHADAGHSCVGGPRFDPAGTPHVGNGHGQQFIGGHCLSKADCASGCCAGPCGICSGVGAQFQAGKTGCSNQTFPE